VQVSERLTKPERESYKRTVKGSNCYQTTYVLNGIESC